MKNDIFYNESILKDFLSPLKNWNINIFYKKFFKSEEDYFLPIGPKSTKNHSIDDYDNKLGDKDLIEGIIIDIYNTGIFYNITSDEQRGGRQLSLIDFDRLSDLLKDIEVLKYKCDDECYTISTFINNNGFDKPTNFTEDAPLSIIILNAETNIIYSELNN